jgi:hypothetical protein
MSVTIGNIIIGVTIALIGIILILTLITTRRGKETKPEQPAANPGSPEAVVIPPGHSELVKGPVTLTINSSAKSTLISYLVLSLSEDPNIQMVSKGGVTARGSWIKLFIKNPIPLFKVLYQIPIVQEVSRKGFDIHVVTI